jgi:hypothetical protein
MFNYIINICELREIDMSGGQFTWSNNQAVPTLEKLDRFLVSKEWELLFPLTTIHKLSREISDHSPIILDTMEGREKQIKEFRSDKRWLKEENFLPKVYRIWSQPVRARDSLSCFQQKLKNLKKFLKGWGANIRGRDINKKKELTQELVELEAVEETMNLSFDQAKRKCKVQEELLLIYEKDEDFWKQRSREQWLLKGDNNTEYFHRCANGQKRKRTIFSLQNGLETVQGTPDLLAHATSFYKDLFGPQQMS